MIGTSTGRCMTLDTTPGTVVSRLAGPAMDAWSTDDRFVLEADLPGFRIEDLDLTIEDGILTIAGSRAVEREEGVRRVLAERPSGSFRRAFRLPFDVEVNEVDARLADGVLTLSAPRSAATRPRKVQVNAG